MKVFVANKVRASLEGKLREGLDWVNWTDIVAPGARVSIKPNFTYPRHKPGVTTTPALLEAAVKILSERTWDITIVESDGGLDAWTADEAFERHGVTRLAALYGVRAVNLSRAATVSTSLAVHGREVRLDLPKLLLDETDVFVTMPVLKTHTQTGVSLGIKNMWGCIPSTRRLLYHSVLADLLVHFVRLFKPALSIIDALWAMDGLGPMYGDVVQTNGLLVADHIGAGEVAGCCAMGISATKIPHLALAQKHGLIPPAESVEYNISPEDLVGRRFKPRRDLRQHLVHYGPFRSRTLSYLIYLSPLSVLKNLIVGATRGQHLT